MIVIPNMEKPKRCGDCWALDDKYDYPMCLITQEQRGYDFNTMTRVMDKCPLIEIDLERDIPTIWYNRQTGQYEPKDTKQEVYERLYKLKNGERRADDRPTEHIWNDQT